MTRPRTTGVNRTVCVCVLEEMESDTSKGMTILTKVALDSVFAHADAKCETRMTLKNHPKENA
jgi:hypothetical protein